MLSIVSTDDPRSPSTSALYEMEEESDQNLRERSTDYAYRGFQLSCFYSSLRNLNLKSYHWRPNPVLNTAVKPAWVIIGILSASRRSTAGKGKGHADHLESTLWWYSATATTPTTSIKSGKQFIDAMDKRQLDIALGGLGTGQTIGEKGTWQLKRKGTTLN